MPTAPPQVDLQAPPGLEAPVQSSSLSAGPPVEPPPQDPAQAELVRQVTQAIAQQVEAKTTAAVEALWEKGQKAMTFLLHQQQAETMKLQGQLTSCAESYAQLKHDNYILNQRLEALMQRMAVLYQTTPSYMSAQQENMQMAAAMAVAQAQAAQQASQAHATSQAAAAMVAAACAAPTPAPAPQPPPPAQPAPSTPALQPKEAPAAPKGEDFHTPAASPLRQATIELENAPAPATPQPSAHDAAQATTTGPADAAAAAATVAPLGKVPGFPLAPTAPSGVPPVTPIPGATTPAAELTTPQLSAAFSTFKITLRRADGVALGLDVRGDSGEPFLEVQAVKAGGAVEALNKQFAGDAREIRPGDRIIAINGAEEADAMREQCTQKFLLKMTLSRPLANEPGTPQSAGSRSMRAEADEFVPQSPWLTPSQTPNTGPKAAPAAAIAATSNVEKISAVTSTMTSC